MPGYYILDRNRLAVPCDLMTWARMIERRDGDRVIAQEYIGECYWVSTVFLGVNHNFGEGDPLLFETMIFDLDRSDVWMERCGTWDEALDMHERAVAEAQRLLRLLPVAVEE